MARERTPKPPARDEGGVSAQTRAQSALGVLAAVVLAILGNVLVARHYKRWDWTSSRLYSLSEPTRQTLRGLSEPVQINVLLSSGDALLVSVRHLLDAYGSETDKLDVRYLDPDKRPAEFLAFQQKYNLLAGRTEDGRVVADASIVVVKGDKRWFLTPTDLVDVSEADEGRARPKLEQGLTTAIRSVQGGDKSRICFAKGHGELGADEGGARGLGELKHRLDRNNVEVTVVDMSAQDAKADPWGGCTLVIVASPQQPYSEAEGKALGAYLEGGGNLLLFVNPLLDAEKKRLVPSGLGPLAARGGIELRGDLVFERDKAFRVPSGMGESFLAQAKPNAITEALVGPKAAGTKILMVLAQSLGRVQTGFAPPAELLVTSKEAFGMADFFSWTDEMGAPDKRPGDHDGPLPVAMAVELPRPAVSRESHGPRMVVVGSGSVTQGQSWQEPALRGGAYFVESAISWLTSRPQIVDIPAKPAVMAGMRITEESLKQIGIYVTVYIPLAMGLVALAIFLRRRSTEKRKDASQRTRDGGEGT